MSFKTITSVAALAAAVSILAPPLAFAASPQRLGAIQSVDALSCRYVGAISHRCYTFHSDATWPEGMPDYHGSNGS